MAETYGEKRLFDFVKASMRDGLGYDNASRQVCGNPFKTVDRTCVAWIRKQVGWVRGSDYGRRPVRDPATARQSTAGSPLRAIQPGSRTTYLPDRRVPARSEARHDAGLGRRPRRRTARSRR